MVAGRSYATATGEQVLYVVSNEPQFACGNLVTDNNRFFCKVLPNTRFMSLKLNLSRSLVEAARNFDAY